MRQSPKQGPVPQSDSGQNVIAVLLRDMADTTWRMFVPIVGLLLAGRYVDGRLGTKPVFMLVGAAIGACIAALLIKRQLKKDA